MRYIGDWVYDDEPTTIAHGARPARNFARQFRDARLATMVLQTSRIAVLARKVPDTLDRYIAESAERIKIMPSRCTPTSWASRIVSTISKELTRKSTAIKELSI